MLSHIARFELRYQLTSAIFWITSAIFFGMSFWFAGSDSLRVGWGGYVFRNSPFAIMNQMMILSIFSIFIVTSFMSNVILRDDETRFGPILRATRLSNFDYLFGRFIGAFTASALVFIAVPLGALAASLMPWVEPETLGSFRVDAYLYSYFVLCLPTVFILGAGLFALATITRSMLTTYIAALVLLMVYLLAAAYLNRPEVRAIAALFDPFGMSAFKVVTQYWTPTERNSQLVPIVGALLVNRVLWLVVAVGLLGLTWRSFIQAGQGSGKVAADGSKNVTSKQQEKRVPSLPSASPKKASDGSLSWSPLIALTKLDVMSVVRSPAFIVLVGIALGNAIIGLWYSGDDAYNATFPVTRLMITTLGDQFSLIPLIIAAFYAGELVWRDRERRMHEIVDATPAADWIFVVPKIIAISVVLFIMAFISAFAAIIVQVSKGYFNFELSHYLFWYLVPWLITMTQYAVLAVFIQMLVPNKFGGLLVTLLILAAQLSFPKFGWENHLYLFASSSAVPLSDMNGEGVYAEHAAWFRAYWSAASALMAVLAYALWRRGSAAPLKQRIRNLPARLKGPAGWIAVGSVVAMVATGGYVYYNTHVLNEWRTVIDSQRWSAAYEKELFKYNALPQPRITDVKLNVDIHSETPSVVTRGSYMLENKTAAPIKDVVVFWARQVEESSTLGADVVTELKLRALELDGAHMTREIPDLHFRIYTFDKPLEPGARVEMRFETLREQRGFKNNNNETRIVENGTFLNNWELTPALGMHSVYALHDRTVRRKYGLSDEIKVAGLDDVSARGKQYLRPDSDWVNADLTISTAADQTIVAPGERVDSKVDGNRRTDHFKTTAPMLHFFTMLSARYELQKKQDGDVSLEVYYHKPHATNVDRMMKAMETSLDYYSKNFSPYQFKSMRIVEIPAYRSYAQSFPGTIAYSEAAGFIIDPPAKDSEKYDGITYITAHELAHQWWAHQVIGADVEGQTVLSETLAQYSAMMVMEKLFGTQEIRKFLKQQLDGYLKARGTTSVAEVPLERVVEQAHIRYLKGGMVMYLLKDQMGEEAVNRALRSLIKDFAFKSTPYPTSRDLISRLRAEAGSEHQQLITDLFEKITMYDLRAVSATKTKRADGKWDVAIKVDAQKYYANERGDRTIADMNEQFDIGVFTAEPGKSDFKANSILFMQRKPVHSGEQTVSLIVDHEPKFVGIDPYNKYVDSNSDDNVIAVPTAQ